MGVDCHLRGGLAMDTIVLHLMNSQVLGSNLMANFEHLEIKQMMIVLHMVMKQN